MIDALALSMGIKVVESPFIEPGKAFLFREPVPMKFEIPKPVFEPERDFTRFAMYSCFRIATPEAIIIGCDFANDDRTVVCKVRKWHWKYRGPRSRSRRRCIPSNPRGLPPGVPVVPQSDNQSPPGRPAPSCSIPSPSTGEKP